MQRAVKFVLKSSEQDHILCREKKKILCLGLKLRVM